MEAGVRAARSQDCPAPYFSRDVGECRPPKLDDVKIRPCQPSFLSSLSFFRCAPEGRTAGDTYFLFFDERLGQ